MEEFHKSVLLEEAIEYLHVKNGGRYIDATVGGGGHTFGILGRGGRVLGIDHDQEAVEFVRDRIKNQELRIRERMALVRGNFKDIRQIAREEGFEKVDGILFDLGVSSYQFDTPQRGFSFSKDADLDMRMDTNLSVKASDLVNALSVSELTELFKKLGEDDRARVIATEIVKRRSRGKIETTGQLVKIIVGVVPRTGRIHPATKVFQALRIAVNAELENLRLALPCAIELLGKGGRLVVISFHSLEDRIVKQYFLEFESKGLGHIVTKKPIIASEEELVNNRRARSAKMRVFERD